jgi:hypothetical protein
MVDSLDVQVLYSARRSLKQARNKTAARWRKSEWPASLDRRCASAGVFESKLRGDASQNLFPARNTGVLSFLAEFAQTLRRPL